MHENSIHPPMNAKIHCTGMKDHSIQGGVVDILAPSEDSNAILIFILLNSHIAGKQIASSLISLNLFAILGLNLLISKGASYHVACQMDVGQYMRDCF